MKRLLITAALITLTTSAFADSYVSTSNCGHSRVYGYSKCSNTVTYVPDRDRNLEQERLDALAIAKEDAKWEAFCKPSRYVDSFGMTRMHFAQTGCEFGRSE